MIDAYYYEYIYVFLVLVLTLSVIRRYSRYGQERVFSGEKEKPIKLIVVSLLCFVFIATRPFSIVFCDMMGYGDAMLTHVFEGQPITWSNNYLFTPLMAFLSSKGCEPRVPIVVLSGITIIGSAIAARKMFPNDSILAFLVILGSFSMFGKLVNGIKAGCAMSIFLCALAYRDKKWLSILLLVASMGFHHSMQVAVVAYIIASFYKGNEKVYFFIWIVCLLLAIAHVQYFQFLFGTMTDDSGARYLLSDYDDAGFGGKTGFRLDFVLFSAAPVLVGYTAIFIKNIQSESYKFLLNIYLLTSAVWMLCMYAPYTNRIAEISWGIYPIVLIYPFLKEKWGINQYKTLSKVVFYNVMFSFLMVYVYYTLIHINR